MRVAVGDGADIERKGAPPRGADAFEIVLAAAPQDRADMDDRYAERAGAVMKRVDRGHDLARPRRRTGAFRRRIEMAAMHVDRHDRRRLRVEIILELTAGVLWLAVDKDAHVVASPTAVNGALREHEVGPARRARWCRDAASRRPTSSRRWSRDKASSSSRYCGTRMPAAAMCGITASMQPNNSAPASAAPRRPAREHDERDGDPAASAGHAGDPELDADDRDVAAGQVRPARSPATMAQRCGRATR